MNVTVTYSWYWTNLKEESGRPPSILYLNNFLLILLYDSPQTFFQRWRLPVFNDRFRNPTLQKFQCITSFKILHKLRDSVKDQRKLEGSVWNTKRERRITFATGVRELSRPMMLCRSTPEYFSSVAVTMFIVEWIAVLRVCNQSEPCGEVRWTHTSRALPSVATFNCRRESPNASQTPTSKRAAEG